MGLLGSQVVKTPPASAEDVGSVSGLGRSPGEGSDNPREYSCLGNLVGQRSLVGYSLWGHKELDATAYMMVG